MSQLPRKRKGPAKGKRIEIGRAVEIKQEIIQVRSARVGEMEKQEPGIRNA